MKTIKPSITPVINKNEEISRAFQNHGEINMRNRRADNNTVTGNLRRELTLKIAARFGYTSVGVLAFIYKIKPRQAAEHLNKQVSKGLLKKVNSMRCSDGAVFVPTATGAAIVKDLLDVNVFFRRTKEGREINQSTVNHDLVNQIYLLKQLQLTVEFEGDYYYKHAGVVTEHETRKIMRNADYCTVDGMLLTFDHDKSKYEKTGVEIEGCFKSPQQRSERLLAFLRVLRAKVYDNITLTSHNRDILLDAERINNKLIIDLCNVRKSDGTSIINGEDAALLESKISYDDSFCDELTALFYK